MEHTERRWGNCLGTLVAKSLFLGVQAQGLMMYLQLYLISLVTISVCELSGNPPVVILCTELFNH